MSNGNITEAEIDALLSGSRRSIDRLLITGQKEIQATLSTLSQRQQTMIEVCEQRGLICPGLHEKSIADPHTPTPPVAPDDRRTWVMWEGWKMLTLQVGLPILVVVATLVITGKL
jgi:hypothetical protein